MIKEKEKKIAGKKLIERVTTKEIKKIKKRNETKRK